MILEASFGLDIEKRDKEEIAVRRRAVRADRQKFYRATTGLCLARKAGKF